eukprot:SAG31_NODE_9017_length_1347_cov_1.751603_1_plen_338_part_10
MPSNWDRALQAALSLKDEGAIDDAVWALQALVAELCATADCFNPGKESHHGVPPAKRQRRAALGQDLLDNARRSSVAEAAEYELALLLHSCGRHMEADRTSAKLGFTHRLSDVVFAGGNCNSPLYQACRPVTRAVTSHVRCYGKKGPDVPLAMAYDDVLSVDLQTRLERAFGPNSDFWSLHKYPTDQFFSYNSPLPGAQNQDKTTDSGSCSLRRSARAASGAGPPGGRLLQQLAMRLLPLARPVFDHRGSESDSNENELEPTSFEWWAHLRPDRAAGHQMHFDLDEIGLLESPATPSYPLASCVVYLGSNKSGVPTLVTDLHVSDAADSSMEADSESD